MSDDDLFERAARCLAAADADHKLALTRDTAAAWRAGALVLTDGGEPAPIAPPGRPAHLRLVRPRELPRRREESVEGRAILYHALVHIEFNAIDLAWDAVYRFRGLPRAYYDDWVRIADEEAYHFGLLRDHLRTLGADYGDWPAHNGLWEMATQTAHDPLARMALVPRCLEARGLDVNPGIKERLLAVGDSAGAALLDIILRDEIGHVTVGDRWFRHLCAARGLAPEATYRDLLGQYLRGPVRGPFHTEARLRAGFTAAELAELAAMK